MRSTCLRPLRALSVLMCMNVTVSGAQNIDSLKAVWHDTSLHDTIRLMAFKTVIRNDYLFSRPDSTLILADSMRTYARSRGWKLNEGDAVMIRGTHFIIIGDFPAALRELSIAEDLYKEGGSASGVAGVQTNIGNVYWKQGQLKSAIEMYTAALRTMERLGNKKGVANAELNIGLVYSDLGDAVRAKDHSGAALAIYTELGAQNGIASASHNLAGWALVVGDTAGAVGLLHTAFDAFVRAGNTMEQMTPLLDLAKIHTEQRQWDLALRYMDRADSLGRYLGAEFSSRVHFARGYYHLTRQEFALALAEGEAANALAAKTGTLVDRKNVAQLLYRSNRELGRLAEALRYLDLYQVLNDSLRSEENERGLLRQEFTYAYEKEALADSLAHQEEKHAAALLHEKELGAERGRRNMLIAGLLIAVLIGAGVWARMRYMQRTNRQIVAAQAMLMESERQREAEKVRTRIASDIHDQLGSDLTKLSILSSEIKEALNTDPAHLVALATDIERVTDEAARSLSDIVWAVDPHRDNTADLVDRIRTYAEGMLSGSGVAHTIEHRHDGQALSLDPATKRDLYLVAREALNNALKYAQAGHIQVITVFEDGLLRLAVADDGAGFDMATTSGAGNGMASMAARAKRTGGRLHVESSPQKGTRVSFELGVAN